MNSTPPPRRSFPWQFLSLLLVLVTGCGGGRSSDAKHPTEERPAGHTARAPAQLLQPANEEWDHSQAKVPVTKSDPIWGQPSAPVTIVALLDLECSFCGRVAPTLERIKQKYGPAKVRIVFLHNPLPFHERAYAAALAAETVRDLSGSAAFFRFVDFTLSHQQDLTDENFVAWAVACGVDAQTFRDKFAGQRLVAKVDADMALAKQIGATGTPAFRINGITLSGAQPLDKFEALIDEQLEAAAKIVAEGVRPLDAYVTLTNRNFELPPPVTDTEKDSEDDVVWKIPVMADDPALGRANAPVTIVEFCDFECAFCRKVQATLKQIQEQYRDDVRIVWKDNPLPFHANAMPAAVLARLVLERRGNAAFFTISDRFFDARLGLTETTLKELAQEYRIAWIDVEKALEKSRTRQRIEASMELASDYGARGTPHFFINGIRLAGARPLEKFQRTVGAQLTNAKTLLGKGVPRGRIYQEIMKSAKEPPPPERKEAPLPTAGRPSLGPRNAPIVIQEWSDFECPFCGRVQPTLDELKKEFPNQIRIVWRHLPLPFHPHASVAAEIAEEVLAQKGNPAFWAFHDRVFLAQEQPDGLSETNLTRIAVELGIDEEKLRQSLDAHRHRPVIDADSNLAHDIDISGTPAFVVNGYFISGAQPIGAFRRAVRRALDDTLRGKRR